MKKINSLKILKILFSIFATISVFYFFEFYIETSNVNGNFWCIQVSNDFNIGSYNISLPIHCDEGPYRLASTSLEKFFSAENPYQTRPLYVFLIFLLRQFVETIFIFELSDYQNFRISSFLVQIIILGSIVYTFSYLMKLKFDNLKDYLLIALVVAIPGIRWNIFFPSAGNLTLLFFLICLALTAKKTSLLKNKNNVYIFFSFISLAHLSSIIYGLILELIDLLKTKKINFLKRLQNIFLLGLFPLVYRLLVYISDYEFYDWHTGVYSQFSWIMDELQTGNFFTFVTLNAHLKTYSEVTIDYLGHFLLLIIYFVILLAVVMIKKQKVPRKIKFAFFINTLIFLFWGLQGIYESFRFTNYSIGYFLFISIFILIIDSFKKNVYLIFSILFYFASIGYLEPYNNQLDYPQLNLLTFFSILFFLVFSFQEIKLNYETN